MKIQYSSKTDTLAIELLKKVVGTTAVITLDNYSRN